MSITAVDAVMKERYQPETSYDWNGVEVKIRPSIGLKDMLEFVNDAVTSCFQQEHGFMPELLDFVIKSNILTRYANFNLPENLEHRYEIVYYTDAVDFVCEKINGEQLHEIIASISRKVHYLSESDISAVGEKMQKIADSFDELEQKLSEVFGGISPDDMAKIASSFADGRFSEEKLVSAYLDQTRSQTADRAGEE